MQAKVFLLAAMALTAGCGQPFPPASSVKYDAAHSVALDGLVDQGLLVTATTNETTIKNEIIQQLWYTTGQLNGIGGVADMARVQVTGLEVEPRSDGRFAVTYAAKLFVSWPKERPVPKTLTLVLPVGGDNDSLARFYAAYGSDEQGAKLCMDAAAHDVSQGIFWYYYRPAKSTCSLASGVEAPDLVRRFDIRFDRSGENTEGKSPEYGKIWEDGKLVATAIFGKYASGATALSDAGIAAFRQTYADLLAKFGQPTASNLAVGAYPDAAHDDVRLVFNTPSGPIDIHLYLVNSILEVDSAFLAKYEGRTRISDFVSYSGHSGLGANIRALARMGQFEKGQYQIFFINGCDTFAYAATDIRNAHQAVNPGAGPDQYFDMITNGMPSYFAMNSRSNLAIIDALVTRQKTYRQILAGVDQSQRAAVTGEEDNRWPLPFQEAVGTP